MTRLKLDSIIQRDSEIIAVEMGNETVMMGIDQSKYFGLNEVGTTVWENIEKPITIQALVHVVRKNFDIEEKDCLADILELVSDLMTQGLARVVPSV